MPETYWKCFEAGDEAGALAVLEQEALSKQNAVLMFLLGQEYGVAGSPPIQDYAKAAQWFKRAAELGDAKAKYEYGLALVLGLGVEKEVQVGVKYIFAAADDGNPLALRFLFSTEKQALHNFKLSEKEAIRYLGLARTVDMNDF